VCCPFFGYASLHTRSPRYQPNIQLSSLCSCLLHGLWSASLMLCDSAGSCESCWRLLHRIRHEAFAQCLSVHMHSLIQAIQITEAYTQVLLPVSFETYVTLQTAESMRSRKAPAFTLPCLILPADSTAVLDNSSRHHPTPTPDDGHQRYNSWTYSENPPSSSSSPYPSPLPCDPPARPVAQCAAALHSRPQPLIHHPTNRLDRAASSVPSQDQARNSLTPSPTPTTKTTRRPSRLAPLCRCPYPSTTQQPQQQRRTHRRSPSALLTRTTASLRQAQLRDCCCNTRLTDRLRPVTPRSDSLPA